MNLAQAFGAGTTIAQIWFSLGRLFTFSCLKGQRVSLALRFPSSWHRAWHIPVIATRCFVKSQIYEHMTGWMMKRCVFVLTAQTLSWSSISHIPVFLNWPQSHTVSLSITSQSSFFSGLLCAHCSYLPKRPSSLGKEPSPCFIFLFPTDHLT